MFRLRWGKRGETLKGDATCANPFFGYTDLMNKQLKAFFGIVSISPLLFLVGLALSFVAYEQWPTPITMNAQVMNIFMIIGGVAILFGTVLALRSQKISRVISHPDTKVTSADDLMKGPYRYSRHPGALALMIMYIGFVLMVNSLVMVAFAIIFIALLTLIFVPLEEKSISELCPEAYADYKSRVRMWV